VRTHCMEVFTTSWPATLITSFPKSALILRMSTSASPETQTAPDPRVWRLDIDMLPADSIDFWPQTTRGSPFQTPETNTLLDMHIAVLLPRFNDDVVADNDSPDHLAPLNMSRAAPCQMSDAPTTTSESSNTLTLISTVNSVAFRMFRRPMSSLQRRLRRLPVASIDLNIEMVLALMLFVSNVCKIPATMSVALTADSRLRANRPTFIDPATDKVAHWHSITVEESCPSVVTAPSSPDRVPIV